MFSKALLMFSACVACTLAQQYQHQGPTTTPVPILKQINKQNDDGSYSYGYEGADGSFKIETKYANGDVAGKYGYVDENGKTREISYGASSKRGFEPEGSGIMVPPPTLNDGNFNALTEGQEDDGQYREDPSIYEDPKYNSRAPSRPGKQQSFTQQFHTPAQPQYQQPQVQAPQPSQFRSNPLYTQQTSHFNQPAQPQQNFFSQAPQQFPQQEQIRPQEQYRPQQQYRPQSQVFHQQPQFSYQGYQPQPQGYNQYQPQSNPHENFNPFFGHPAQNFDPNTGSYTINFTG